MRYVVLTAVALLSWSWAQQSVSPSQAKVDRLMRIMEKERMRGIRRTPVLIPLETEAASQKLSSHSFHPAARISQNVLGLSWLHLHQDADTVPTTTNTTNVYGLDVSTDTLLAPGVGSDINPTLSNASICEHHYFDSLGAQGAYLGGYIPEPPSTNAGRFIYIGGNCLDSWGTDGDTNYVFGGRVAQRYSFRHPSYGGSLSIKGIAAWITKDRFRGNTDARRCTTYNAPPIPDNGDGDYTIYFMLLNTDTVIWGNFGPATYPAETLRIVAKPAKQIRLGALSYDTLQCVLPDIGAAAINPSYPTGGGYFWHHRLMERLMYVYFDTPYDVQTPEDLYVAVAYEMYDPFRVPSYSLEDTFFIPIGPFSPQGLNNHPCLHDTLSDPDTVIIPLPYELGRCMVGFNEYNTANEAWQAIYWRPERTLWTDRLGYLLDFPIFPIISYSATSSSLPAPIRSGSAIFYTPYPNPAVECLHLQANMPASTDLEIYLITTDGRFVRTWTRHLSAGDNTIAVDVNDVPAGAYLFQVQSPYGAATFWVNIVK